MRLLLVTGTVDLDSKDSDGCTPLSRATQNGHDGVVKLLLATRRRRRLKGLEWLHAVVKGHVAKLLLVARREYPGEVCEQK